PSSRTRPRARRGGEAAVRGGATCVTRRRRRVRRRRSGRGAVGAARRADRARVPRQGRRAVRSPEPHGRHGPARRPARRARDGAVRRAAHRRQLVPVPQLLPAAGQGARGADRPRSGAHRPALPGGSGAAGRRARDGVPNASGDGARPWLEQLQHELADWRKVLRIQGESDDVPLRPQRVAWELNAQLPPNAILCGDSGTNTTYFARYLDIRPGMLASGSGNLATMASGLPYALGAQLAFPDRRAVAFVGDGAFTMLM